MPALESGQAAARHCRRLRRRRYPDDRAQRACAGRLLLSRPRAPAVPRSRPPRAPRRSRASAGDPVPARLHARDAGALARARAGRVPRSADRLGSAARGSALGVRRAVR